MAFDTMPLLRFPALPPMSDVREMRMREVIREKEDFDRSQRRLDERCEYLRWLRQLPEK